MRTVGEAAYLLRFARRDGPLRALHGLDRLVAGGRMQVADAVPGANTLLVRLDAPGAIPARDLAALELRADREGDGPGMTGRLHEVPVRYDGVDLPALASAAGLSVDQAIELHAGAGYRVAFLGFQPGFAYLDGLPAALRAPRLDTPRPRVAAGSVGIGGEWTGIYPGSTPGGWRLLGTSPDLVLFDPAREPPCLLAPGDRVRFVRLPPR